MKKLMVVIALVMSVAALGRTANVTDTGPGAAGDVLYYTGPAGNDQGTWEPLPTLVQQIINNNTVVPATVGTSLNSGAVSTVGNVDVTGTGITQTVTGSGASGTSSYDFSNLQTVQGNTNATNITNLTSTVNSNSTDISSLQTTVANHTTQINQNTSDISTLNTNLTNEANTRQSQIDAINNMSDPSTVLNQAVNNNTTAITNETSRATGAETTLQNNINTVDSNHTANEQVLQNNINSETTRATNAEGALQDNINNEAATRASADQNLQNQINNVNAATADNTARIDRLEQTKYLLEPTVRLYDDKHFQVQAFDSYDVRHTMNFAAGLRVMYKLGPSYEEKLMKKTNPEIARLLAANVNNDVAERDAIKKQLAEDRALIVEQAALIKQLTPQPVALSANVAKVAPDKVLPFKDEDLLQALDSNNEAFATK